MFPCFPNSTVFSEENLQCFYFFFSSSNFKCSFFQISGEKFVDFFKLFLIDKAYMFVSNTDCKFVFLIVKVRRVWKWFSYQAITLSSHADLDWICIQQFFGNYQHLLYWDLLHFPYIMLAYKDTFILICYPIFFFRRRRENFNLEVVLE